MILSRPSLRPSWFGSVAFAGATAVLGAAAAMVLFSTFMLWDDEGYLLISLRNFAAHGGLYRDVYTQYGPFPFVFYSGLHALGLPINHLTGRLVTLATWIGTAWACALLAGQAGRSLPLRLAVLAGAFVYLAFMVSEPAHPGGLIVMITLGLATLGYRWIVRGQESRWAIGTAAGATLLLLTKINVGVFAGFSIAAWWLLHHQSDAVRRRAPLVLAILAVALPLTLMRPLLGTPWVQDFALVFACAAPAVIFAAAAGASGRIGWRAALPVAAVAAGLVVVLLGFVWGRGSSLPDLVEGLVLGPLRHPGNFNLPFLWPAGIRFIALGSLAVFFIAWFGRHRQRRRVDDLVALLRLAAAVALALTVLLAPHPERPDYLVHGLALSLLWPFVWPLEGEEPNRLAGRSWVALLLLGQSLHAFPVPGSQVGWGTILALPLAALGAWDAANRLKQRFVLGAGNARLCTLTVSLALLAFAVGVGGKFATRASTYATGQNPALPGTEFMRLPDASAALLRALTLNAAIHTDVLFSLPGAYSFNLWAEVPTPTRANATHWFSLLDPARQLAIREELEKHPRAGLIVLRDFVKILARVGHAPRGPLADYLAANFEPVFAFDGVEFQVRRGRRIAPFLIGELLTRAPAAGSAAPDENTLLRISLLLPPAQPIARVELTTAPGTPTPALVLDRTTARAETTALDARGTAKADTRPAAWPLALETPCALSLYYDRTRLPQPARDATVIFRDAAGEVIGLARLQP